MNLLRRLWMVALLSLCATPALADWSIGSNLGLVFFSPRGGGDGTTVFSWPGGTGLALFAFQPGLRIGVLTESKQHEFYVDNALSIISGGGDSFNQFIATVNYQYNFNKTDPTTPYLTGGVGFMRIGDDNNSNTNAVFGAGLGVRHRVGHGYGTFRGEVRVDDITEDDTGFRGGTAVGLKFGFDLWMD